MISFSYDGNFEQTLHFLRKMQKFDFAKAAEAGAKRGAAALSAATPIDSGLAASSWDYDILKTKGGFMIGWKNADVEEGYPVAIMIQYGHGTGTGGWVQGIDYINPAMRPIFDEIANDVWKAVTAA